MRVNVSEDGRGRVVPRGAVASGRVRVVSRPARIADPDVTIFLPTLPTIIRDSPTLLSISPLNHDPTHSSTLQHSLDHEKAKTRRDARVMARMAKSHAIADYPQTRTSRLYIYSGHLSACNENPRRISHRLALDLIAVHLRLQESCPREDQGPSTRRS